MRHLALCLALLAPCVAHAADADAGSRVFRAQCGACHVAGKNLIGPNLVGLIGRHAGAVEGFRYSAANKAADFTWDAARLDPYLADPKAVIPGTSMLYAGLKDDARRADVIAYLETLK